MDEQALTDLPKTSDAADGETQAAVGDSVQEESATVEITTAVGVDTEAVAAQSVDTEIARLNEGDTPVDSGGEVVSFDMPESSTSEAKASEIIIVDVDSAAAEFASQLAEAATAEDLAKETTAAAPGKGKKRGSKTRAVSEAASTASDNAVAGDNAAEKKEIVPVESEENDSGATRTEEELRRFRNILEGVLLVAGEAVPVSQLAKLFEPPLTSRFTTTLLNEIKEQWKGREVELVAVASGWRFQGSPEVRRHMERLSVEKPPRYSRAVMETLAIIAYRQPVTRGEIESIRGVAVSTNIIKALEDRQWIEAVGHKETPGRPSLYATTKKFLDDLGLRSLAELPPLAELDSSHLLEMPDAPTKSAEAPRSLASPIIAETSESNEVAAIESGDAGVCGDAAHENQESH